MNVRRRSGELGPGLVELAVIFTLFVFFLFAVLDVGIAMNRRATLQHAAREGARYAATRTQADQATIDRTVSQAQSLVDDEDVCITYSDIDDETVAVDVEVEYFYEPFILNIGLGFFDANIPDVDMTVTGSARVERELDDDGAFCP